MAAAAGGAVVRVFYLTVGDGVPHPKTRVNDIASCFPELHNITRKIANGNLEVIACGSLAVLDKFKEEVRRMPGWVLWQPPGATVDPDVRAQEVIETSQRDSVRLVDLRGHRIARTPAEFAGGEDSSGGGAGADLHWEHHSAVDSTASIASSLFRQEMLARIAAERERDYAVQAREAAERAAREARVAAERAAREAAEELAEAAGISVEAALERLRRRAATRGGGATVAAAGGAGDA